MKYKTMADTWNELVEADRQDLIALADPVKRLTIDSVSNHVYRSSMIYFDDKETLHLSDYGWSLVTANTDIEKPLPDPTEKLKAFIEKVAHSLDSGSRFNGYNAYDLLWDLKEEAAALLADSPTE